MKKKITKTEVDKLEKGDFIADTEIRGFIARRLPSGTVTFSFKYTAPDSRQPRWAKLGIYGNVTVEEARNSAKKKAGEVADGGDPAAEERVSEARSKNTVKFVFDEWYAKYAQTAKNGKPLRSADEIKGIFERHVFPKIGEVPVYDLNKTAGATGSVTDMFDEVKVTATAGKKGTRGGTVMVNRVYTHLKTVLAWWRDRDDKFVIDPLPSKKPGGGEKKRDRNMPWDEIVDFWRATEELEDTSKRYWRGVLLCGGRRSEVAQIHPREFEHQREHDVWVVPADRYKTDIDHVIPLTASLKEALPDVKDGYLFSSTGGEKPISGYSKMKITLDKKINQLRAREGRPPIKPWQIRDLRRSCRTRMVELGINEYHAKAVTGHKMIGIDGVYNCWDYLPQKADAIEKFAAHIKSLVGPSPDNLVPFPQKGSTSRTASARRSRAGIGG